jgi:hypothetical protein
MSTRAIAAAALIGIGASGSLAQDAAPAPKPPTVSPHALALAEIVENYQAAPAGLKSENGWTELLSLLNQFEGMLRLYDAEHADLFAGKEADSNDDVRSSFSVIRKGPTDEHERTLEKAGTDFIQTLDRVHFFDSLDRLPDLKRFVAPPILRGETMGTIPHLGPSRSLAACCAARMHLFAARGDWAQFVQTFEDGLAVGRGLTGQCDMISRLIGDMDQTTVFSEAKQELLAGKVNADVAQKLLAAIERQPLPRFGYSLEGERMRGLQLIDEFYDDAAASASKKALDDLEPIVGSRAEDAKVWNEYFDAWAKVLGSDDTARSAASAALQRIYTMVSEGPESKTKYALISVIIPAIDKARPQRGEALRDGLRTMLALEIWRSRHEGYPETLDVLVPAILPSVPKDPFDPAHSLRYRREGQTKYLLYSVGYDGTDNGGKLCPSSNNEAAVRGTSGQGYDFILNTEEP